jgi:DNA-binding NtrC family response regulator
MAQTTILICDDEEGIRRYLHKLLASQGFAVETFAGGSLLLERLRRGSSGDAALLLQDVKMPDMDGIQVLQEVKKLRPALPVVIMTAFGTIDAAVDAIKLGAYDYITKPFPKEKILGVLENALERELLREENRQLKDQLQAAASDDAPIIFFSQRFREVYDLTLQVARSDANILILGESGTGKELIARAVHRHSARRGQRFLSINCAALSDTLLESQLFGHVRGAFTGAVSNQRGILEEADGGTLFMDEIGDMSLAIQAKLLRVIQERDFIPVGATKPKSVDIRFVAATNKDLAKEVQEGNFREDLYYRLNVVNLQLPPLRDRGDDVVIIAKVLLGKYADEMKSPVRGLSPGALAAIRKFPWPGNVRQLENRLKKALVLCDKTLLSPEDLDLGPDALDPIVPLEKAKEDFQREYVLKILERNNGNRTQTARDLGVDPRTIFRYLEKEPHAPPTEAPGTPRDTR